MADDTQDKMVLRTVYLPQSLDQVLKGIAFRGDRSKNDVIRELIQAGIDAKMKGGDNRFKFTVKTGATGRIHRSKTSNTVATRLVEGRVILNDKGGRSGRDAKGHVIKSQADPVKVTGRIVPPAKSGTKVDPKAAEG